MNPETDCNRQEIIDTSTLNKRLLGWVAERIITINPKFLEANARFVIAKAIMEDIKNKEKFDKELVLEKTRKSIELLVDKGLTVLTPKTVVNKDSLHPEEEYKTVFEENESSWLAKEVSSSGETISCAVIFKNGDTLLTINPQGERFIKANPKIILNPNYPRASVETFNLLVGV